MPVDIDSTFSFPEDFPNATTGIFFPEDNILVTGHQNGMVVKWDISTKKEKIIKPVQS